MYQVGHVQHPENKRGARAGWETGGKPVSRAETTLLSICEPYPRPLMALSQLYGDVGFVKKPRRLYPCAGSRQHGKPATRAGAPFLRMCMWVLLRADAYALWVATRKTPRTHERIGKRKRPCCQLLAHRIQSADVQRRHSQTWSPHGMLMVEKHQLGRGDSGKCYGPGLVLLTRRCV